MSQVSDYNAATNAAQRRQEAYDAELAQTRANQEQEVKKVKDDSEAQVSRLKKDYHEQLEAERSQARDEVKRLKEDIYDQSGKNTSREARDVINERSQITKYGETVRAEADKKIANTERASEERSRKLLETQDNRVEDAISAQKRSDAMEEHALQEQLTQYHSMAKDADSERAKAREQTTAEYESSQLSERRRLIEGYERQISKMKEHEAQMEDHFRGRIEEVASDAKLHTQEQIGRQKEEFIGVAKQDQKERRDLENAFTGQLKMMDNRQMRSSEHLIEQNSADKAKLAESKDLTYQNYIAQKSEKQKVELDSRDQKIHELQTNGDPLKASPLLTKRISDTYEKKFQSQLEAAQQSNEKNLQGVQKRDVEERRDLATQLQEKVTDLNRESRRELDVKNRQFFTSFDDQERIHTAQSTSSADEKHALAEQMHQKHALEIAGMQKGKQEALGEQRDVLLHEKNVAIDDADQARRNQDREWAMKANEMRRGLETQLAEERDQHEKITGEMKQEFDKKLRDQARVSTRMTEDRVRGYEYQIKQQELAFKEKERFLTEHYEEELDKMKRTNAHLIQKKS